MRWTRAILLAASFCLASGLAACGGSGTEKSPAAAARPDPHPRPEDAIVRAGVEGVHAGRYVSTVRSGPKTWNPLVSNETSTTNFTSGPLFRSLVFYNYRTQENEPWLAKGWEVDEAGTTWTFRLRRGLRWSDGAPLTAADFMFTVEAMFDTSLNSAVADLAKVDGRPPRFSAPDEHTILVRLEQPYAALLNVMGSIYVLPKHVLEPAYRAGTFESSYGVNTPPAEIVTSGPWMLAEYVPQEKVVLRPNPHYFVFDEAGRRLPYLDELVYRVVPDQNTEVLTFQGGGSDEIYFRPEDYASMKAGEAAGDYTVYDLGMEMGNNFLWFNLKDGSPPGSAKPFVDPAKRAIFSDVRFRRAISHAVDRDGIVRTVYFGLGEPLYGPIPPVNQKWHNPDIPRYPYDLEAAGRLLDEMDLVDRDGDGRREDAAGTPAAFTLLVQADNRERQAMASVLREDLKKIGVDMTVSSVDFNTMVSLLRTTFDYDAMLLGLTGGVPPDPSQSANVFKSSGRTHFWNPEQASPATAWEARIDSLMNEQIVQMDEGIRKGIFDRVQTIMAEQQPAVYLASRRGFLAVRNRFVNLQPSVLRQWVLWESETVSVDPARAPRAGS